MRDERFDEGCERVLDLGEVHEDQAGLVGGKGAHLGALSRVDGVRVPDGFCVTTDAFRQVVAATPEVDVLLGRLAGADLDDRQAVRAISAEVRRAVEESGMPDDLAAEITAAVARSGEGAAYAVRSSATAEDLPTASFAGQQDTYLNIVGPAAVLRHISRCWASLFTERAVTYRRRNGIDDRTVHMAVVVQRMVFPDASGVLVHRRPRHGRPADGHRGRRVRARRGAGLRAGEPRRLPRPGRRGRRPGDRRQGARRPRPAGRRYREVTVEPEQRERPALTDAQVVELVRLGRRIEARFGRPQDIEWCLTDDGFRIVQSRPITTLFPVPAPYPFRRLRRAAGPRASTSPSATSR
ncbi:pyruvate, water dikinase [Streptomyces sp. Ncost-T6T-2b]|nr:pyruvate, water dikinase [Streptomyces sp. Ncost-T6T-2b]